MRSLRRGNRGFTLVELLIVVAILGVLAAVVIPNLVGLVDRGGDKSYRTDLKTLKSVVATFYADLHRGPDANGNWNYCSGAVDHWYPTKYGQASNIELSSTVEDGRGNPQLVIGGVPASEAQVKEAAIWMGLLVNAKAGCADPGAGVSARIAAPGPGECDLYLTEFLKSSSNEENGNPMNPGGTYIWIVGARGDVFGAYRGDDGHYYAGFSGTYP